MLFVFKVMIVNCVVDRGLNFLLEMEGLNIDGYGYKCCSVPNHSAFLACPPIFQESLYKEASMLSYKNYIKMTITLVIATEWCYMIIWDP